MPSPFNFRIVCIAVMEIALFPLVTMRYEPKMRRLASVCIAAIALGVVGVCLSLLRSFYSLPLIAMSAASLSLSAFSSSVLAIAGGVLYFLNDLLRRQGGLRHVLTDWNAWKDTWGSIFRALIVFAILWVPTYLWNAYKSYQVFVSHRPAVKITWTPERVGVVELMPGTGPQSPTPNSLGNRHQYIVEITPVAGTTISSNTAILFRFPYVVEPAQVGLNSWNANASFSPYSSPIPVKLIGPNATFSSQKEYRYWRLFIANMSPSGKVRLVVMLNPDYQDMVISEYTGKKPPKHESLPTSMLSPLPLLGPLNEYIHAYTQFSYGGQTGYTETYAPFQVGSDKIVRVRWFRDPPQNLSVSVEIP